MRSDWQEMNLTDVADLTVGFVGTMATEYKESGVKFIRSMNVQPFKIDFSEIKYISYDFHDKIAKSSLHANDVVIVRTGQPGACAVVPDGIGPLNCSDLVIIHPDQRKIDPLFLSAYINLSSGVISSHLVGAVQQHFNVGSAKKMVIRMPDLTIQRKISSIIKNINDRIETNIQINKNLLQQLQVVYNLKFSKESRDGKPEGQLSDICAYSQRRVAVSSLSPESYFSTENMLPGKAGAVVASSLPSIVQTTGCMLGDVLISNIRPYFKKIVYAQSECGCSTDVLCFVPKTPSLSPYLYSTLYNDHFFDYMVAGSKGTKMPRGDKQQIMAYPVVLPSVTQLAEFNAVAQPILAKIEIGNQENKRLASMRDTLLPKLMSGEIDVSDLEF